MSYSAHPLATLAAVAPRVAVTGAAVAVLLRLHAAAGRGGALLLARTPNFAKKNTDKRQGREGRKEGRREGEQVGVAVIFSVRS